MFIALLAAALVPPTVVLVIALCVELWLTAQAAEGGMGWLAVGLFAFPVSAVHVLILGWPFALLIRRLRWINAWVCIGGGYVLGSIALAVWTWPLKYSSMRASARHWDGTKMVDTLIDGVPTVIGWWHWITGTSLMGFFGALGGLAFWLMWRLGERHKA